MKDRRALSEVFRTAGLAVLVLGATISCARAAAITNGVSGNWHATGTWSGSVVPGTNDNVTIAAGTTVTVAQPSAAYTISNLTVNGTLTHTANTDTNAALYRIDLTVQGDLTVEAGGAISANAKGYSVLKGYAPGPSGGATYAASHGGLCGGAAASPYTTYGSVTNPTLPGSGGSDWTAAYGGGVAILRVGGLARIDGTISAEPTFVNTLNRGGGSGGSVNLTAGTMSGTGTVSASASYTATTGYGGGGGRIAVKLTSGTSFGSVAMRAYGGGGGQGRGAPGTIYRQTGTQADGQGDLVLDAGGYGATAASVTTFISSHVTGAVVGNVVFNSTNCWLGLGANAGMSMSGALFSSAANASLDGIVLLGGTLDPPAVLSCSNLTLWIAGPSTFSPATSLNILSNAVVIADVPHTLTGNLALAAGSLMTHSANNDTNTPHYKVDLTIQGDLTVASNAAIDVKAKGYAKGKGPAPAIPTGGPDYAACHGGVGGFNAGLGPYTTYGSITNPTTLGSGAEIWSGSSGGGAVILKVLGNTTLDGTIRADASDLSTTANRAGASGGSVNLASGTLSGSGSISANGSTNGAVTASAGGGGGRIAVRLGSGTGFDSVRIRAWGGSVQHATVNYRGAPGTIYLQTGPEDDGMGRLIVDAGGFATGAGVSTLISGSVEERSIGALVITNAGKLAIASNVAFGVTGDFANHAQTHSLGGTFVVGGTGTTRFAGAMLTNGFGSFTCTNAGKRIVFPSGSSNRLDGVLTLHGAPGDLLQLAGSGAEPWKLIVPSPFAGSVSCVDVTNSDARGGAAITAYDSIDRGGNSNWTFVSTGGGSTTNQWIGAASSDWGTIGNWSQGRLPIATDAIRITPANSPSNWPFLNDHTVLQTLLVETGARLSLAGKNMTVQTNMVMAGTLAASGSETVTLMGDADWTGGIFSNASSSIVFGGAGPQALAFGGIAFNNVAAQNAGAVTVSGSFSAASLAHAGVALSFSNDLTLGSFSSTRGNVAFGGNLAASNFTVVAPGATLTFQTGGVYAVANLTLHGSVSNRMTLASASPGTAWNLNVSGVSRVSSVTVSDSDAGGGQTIRPVAGVNGGRNGNWVFDSGTWKVWTGASADFLASGNWNPPGAPGPGDSLMIENTGGITAPLLTNTLTVADLAVGGLGAATLTLREPMTVTGRVAILPGGTITHTANNGVGDSSYRVDLAIGGDLEIAAGGTISVKGKGYAAAKGPAPGIPAGGSGYAACHGGVGGVGSASSPYTTYGSIADPTTFGSGSDAWGGGYGGGAVILRVSGHTTLDGSIRADGDDLNSGLNRAGPSGGSVNLTSGTLSGSGVIGADGSTNLVNNDIGGGGGRVAVKLTGGASFGSVRFEVLGGNAHHATVGWRGAPGPIYLQTATQDDGRGTLIVDGGGYATAPTVAMLVSTNVTDAIVGDVVVRGSGRAHVGADALLAIGGSLTNESSSAFAPQTGSTVSFEGTNAGAVWGDHTFFNLRIGDSGTKPLTFEAGKTQTVWGDLSIERAALQSSAPGVWWYLTLDAGGTQSTVQRVVVQDSNASGGQEIRVEASGTDLGHNVNWRFPLAGAVFMVR